MPFKIINFIIVTKEKWDVEVWQYMIFIIKEEFRVYKECNFKIDHENINFETFERLYNNNKLDKIDMNLKKYPRYFFRRYLKITIQLTN